MQSLPRVTLGVAPTPVEIVTLLDGRTLPVKRDDRFGNVVGGNKVRGLEWLLGGVTRDDSVLTVGPTGSTHALATATYAKQLGAATAVVRWDQEMNAAARRVDARLRRTTRVIDAHFLPLAYATAFALRARRPSTRYIPAGGAAPLALLGHVSAALELVEQVERGECARPRRVIVPLGSGGTAAGLWLGFGIAQADIDVVAVRVVPRIVGRAGHVRRLVNGARALLRRHTGRAFPMPDARRLRIEHAFYAGAYGRPLGSTTAIAGLVVDDTYSGKALQAAVAEPDDSLLWLTFDGRLLQD
ncbi:MAG TPA: pyridoxal-phosphate dependent enzyme [Gemmatimonadaceae bacterium]|nr:pyridoxal-phosphate dependent enzyme [Gemmatimonadaceae bacterium]